MSNKLSTPDTANKYTTRRKVAATTLALAAAGSLLSACGGGSSTKPNKTTSTTLNTRTSEPNSTSTTTTSKPNTVKPATVSSHTTNAKLIGNLCKVSPVVNSAANWLGGSVICYHNTAFESGLGAIQSVFIDVGGNGNDNPGDRVTINVETDARGDWTNLYNQTSPSNVMEINGYPAIAQQNILTTHYKGLNITVWPTSFDTSPTNAQAISFAVKELKTIESSALTK